MCGPMAIPIAMAVSTAVGVVQQNKAVKKQAEASAQGAIRSANFQQQQLNQQANEAQSAASEQATAEQLRAAEVASSARVSAGESGVTGTGVNRILGGIGQQAARNLAIKSSNLKGKVGQINTNKFGTQLNLENNLDNIRAQADSAMTGPLEAVAKIGASYFGGLQMGGALGLGAGAAGSGTNILGTLGTLASAPGQFQTPGDSKRTSQAKETGFSDDFLSGNFLQSQLNSLGG